MLNEQQLLKKDFNLLMLLKILGEEKNTSKAAQRMFVTQSTVSKGVKKLRQEFNDELFTRHKDGLMPTDYCNELLEKLPCVFNALSSIYEGKVIDDIENYSGNISIAVNTMLFNPFAVRTVKHFNKIAPNATVEVKNWGWQTEKDLINGNINIGINYFPLKISKEILSKPICDIPRQICARKSHPLLSLNRLPKIEDLAAYPFILMDLPNYSNHRTFIEQTLIDANYTPKVILRSDNSYLCSEILKETDAIMPVASISESFLDSELSIIERDPNIKIAENQIALHYTLTSKGSVLTNWIAKEVEKIVKDIFTANK
ncbi:LysR family transcriptional regulator [Ferrimonas pelagia]|uniref:LysR family transcriptional regulator n=1 Tax=Ferrimonas pelagia TaxID=1177826 RepID=A0ABP9F433_9GAMM